ncbi:hypothetical protein VP01_599g5 [Puccinia sorghi]|uniref:Uncharacterized protein n=1 Tax=Puccinia sorghi TaxID=27349 RepID=A0A0L6UIA2_9BASI|nr:hypothetical protein VP01_599g5 [Puccinia sorghi]
MTTYLIIMILNPISQSQKYNLQQRFEKNTQVQRQQHEETAGLIIALATLGGPMQQLKTYLSRGNLPGDPLAQSFWAYLYRARNNWAFVMMMGFDVQKLNILVHNDEYVFSFYFYSNWLCT